MSIVVPVPFNSCAILFWYFEWFSFLLKVILAAFINFLFASWQLTAKIETVKNFDGFLLTKSKPKSPLSSKYRYHINFGLHQIISVVIIPKNRLLRNLFFAIPTCCGGKIIHPY